MREIKFRVFDKTSNPPQMLEWGDKNIQDQKVKHVFLQVFALEVIIMQYTGLKDSNGVEIYEGDILSFKEENQYSNKPLPVKFSYGNFVVYNPNCCDTCKNHYGCISDLSEAIMCDKSATVIGNIYENPELLK